jgi:hypothetical protein
MEPLHRKGSIKYSAAPVGSGRTFPEPLRFLLRDLVQAALSTPVQQIQQASVPPAAVAPARNHSKIMFCGFHAAPPVKYFQNVNKHTTHAKSCKEVDKGTLCRIFPMKNPKNK